MILGVYGYQDSGKTILVEKTVTALRKKGYKVSTIKHTTGRWSLDQEGKDTWRHGKAGADPVVFSSASETSIIVHAPIEIEDATGLVMREFNPDIIIIEGRKNGEFPKVAVGDIKPLKGTVLRNPSVRSLTSYIEQGIALERIVQLLPGLDCRRCGLDCKGLAKAIAQGRKKLSDCRELPTTDVRITVGDSRISTGRFVADVADKTIRGMLSSFKGYEPGKDIEVRLTAKRRGSKRSEKQG